MKKLFFSLVAAIVAATTMYAQPSEVATLSHNGIITAYYGSDALVEAHQAADHGDIITLSSGSFTMPETITKAITIRGAGMIYDDVTRVKPTVLIPKSSNTLYINISAEVEASLCFEGIYLNDELCNKGTLNNPKFIKTRMRNIHNLGSNASMTLPTFINCRITSATTKGSYFNSIVWAITPPSNSEFVNCIICAGDAIYENASRWEDVTNSTFKNSILLTRQPRARMALGTGCVAYYCVGIYSSDYGTSSSMFSGQTNSTNKVIRNTTALLATLSSLDYNDSETFELTSEAKNTYLGDDDTQVGIYGGTLPYNPTPSNPQITKFNVAPKSTTEGKLSVEIEVKVAE